MPRVKLFLFMALVTALILSACGTKQAQTNPDGSVNVNVTLKDFSIESSVKEFKPGVTYRFTVTNEGQVAHEFMILPIDNSMDMSAMTMEEKDKQALMMISQDQLSPGAKVEKDYTFTSVPQGTIEMVCMVPGHFEAGMRQAITIK